MIEGSDFSGFIDKKKVKLKNEGRIDATPSELLAQDEAERFIVLGMLDGEYELDSYVAEDGTSRVRIRDENNKILYDNTLERYIALCRSLGINLGIEYIEKFQTQKNVLKNKGH
jgi:hypothetical protein